MKDATFSIPEISDIGANLKTIGKLGTFSTIGFTAQGFGSETRARRLFGRISTSSFRR